MQSGCVSFGIRQLRIGMVAQQPVHHFKNFPGSSVRTPTREIVLSSSVQQNGISQNRLIFYCHGIDIGPMNHKPFGQCRHSRPTCVMEQCTPHFIAGLNINPSFFEQLYGFGLPAITDMLDHDCLSAPLSQGWQIMILPGVHSPDMCIRHIFLQPLRHMQRHKGADCAAAMSFRFVLNVHIIPPV